jgi:hypothetical protein
MRRSNFALRLQPSLLDELRKAAELEGVAVNQLINVAVAEKVSALRTEEYFRKRGRRADRAETLRILARSGRGNPPAEGDELPANGQKKANRRAANGRDFVSKQGQKRKRKQMAIVEEAFGTLSVNPAYDHKAERQRIGSGRPSKRSRRS